MFIIAQPAAPVVRFFYLVFFLSKAEASIKQHGYSCRNHKNPGKSN